MTLFTDDFHHNPPGGHVATKADAGMTPPMKAKSKKALISMPEALLEKVDALATKEDRTRSELVREALRLYMKQAG